MPEKRKRKHHRRKRIERVPIELQHSRYQPTVAEMKEAENFQLAATPTQLARALMRDVEITHKQ